MILLLGCPCPTVHQLELRDFLGLHLGPKRTGLQDGDEEVLSVTDAHVSFLHHGVPEQDAELAALTWGEVATDPIDDKLFEKSLRRAEAGPPSEVSGEHPDEDGLLHQPTIGDGPLTDFRWQGLRWEAGLHETPPLRRDG